MIEDVLMPKAVASYVSESKKFDKAFASSVSCFKCNNITTVFCPLDIDEFSKDYIDVREYYRSAKQGIERAVKAGCIRPAIVLPSSPKFINGALAGLLGALAALYVICVFFQ